MRYDSLKAAYSQSITELEQREREIQQLNRVLELERLEANKKTDMLNEKWEVAEYHRAAAIKKIKRYQKQKFALGPSIGYGMNDTSLGVNVGITLTYKLIQF